MEQSLKKVSLPFEIEPGSPEPNVSSDGHILKISVFVNDVEVRRSIVFKSLVQFTFGYPGDEALNGHRYYKLGLNEGCLYEVEQSEVIDQIKEQNKVHSRHTDELFESDRHYILPLKDSTLEVIAEGIDFPLVG